MKKTFFQTFIGLAMALFVITPALTLLPASEAQAVDVGLNYGEQTGLNDTDPRTIAANIIKVILGFLGILAVIIILVGGFKWMTAAGNEDKVAEAKKIIVAGIIGLVIILAAWAIANFVLNALIQNI